MLQLTVKLGAGRSSSRRPSSGPTVPVFDSFGNEEAFSRAWTRSLPDAHARAETAGTQPPLARRAAARAERSVRPERVRGPTRREKTFRGAVHERALARARWRSARGTRGRPPSRDSRRRAKRSRSVRGLPSEVARKPTSGAKTPCDLIDVRRGRQRRRQRSIIAHFLPRLASRMRIASS